MSPRNQWVAIFSWGWRASRAQLLLTSALLIGAGTASVVYPVGIAIVIEAAIHHQPQRLILGTAVVASLYTVAWTFGMYSGIAASQLSNVTVLYITARIADQLNAVSGIDHLERPEYLNELEILQENVRLLGNGARQMLVVLQLLVRTVVIVVILAVIFPPLGLLPLIAAAPVLGERFSVALRQRAEERLAPRRRLADELFEIATSAGPAKELRVFGGVQTLRARHRELAAEITSELERAAALGALCGIAGWLVFAAAFAAGIAAVVIRAAHGHATVSDVVLAVMLIQRTQVQVGTAASSFAQLLTTARHAHRLQWLEDYAAADRSRLEAGPRSAPPTVLRHGIELRGVDFAYPPGNDSVLAGVDLLLPAGSTVALVGENGAGKTTLVKLLTGMYQPTAGQILVDGTPLTEIDLSAWRSRAAATFQDFVCFELVAQEVVGIGELARIDEREAVSSAVHRADATAVVSELPQQLDTQLGRSFHNGQDLSGGQWQRLALARGMMRELPLLLMLDEPTASLDAITEAALFERYLAARAAARAAGAITLLVSHRFSTVRMADLIVVLDDGRIAQSGSHNQLMREGGLYAELFQMQARAYR